MPSNVPSIAVLNHTNQHISNFEPFKYYQRLSSGEIYLLVPTRTDNRYYLQQIDGDGGFWNTPMTLADMSLKYRDDFQLLNVKEVILK